MAKINNKYMCKYCGNTVVKTAGRIPLKTKCKARKPSGLHVWVKVGTI